MVPFLSRGHVIENSHLNFILKNTVGEKQKHCGSDSKTLWERESAPTVFLKMKHETKNETLKSYVSFF